MRIRSAFRWLGWKPSGALGVKALGHRKYVGGYWDEMGQLQLDFMRSRGLEPSSVLVDVACGSLRAGRLFIPYLDAGNYLGIEREQELVNAGLAEEVPPEVVAEKRPEIVVDGAFRFDLFSKRPDLGIANSLFSHVNEDDIRLCLRNLRSFAPNCVFYATFRPSDGRSNPSRSTAHADFRYSPEQMAAMGEATGWGSDYVGEWGHPTGQHMMRFGPRGT
jgi:hypothetical protein